MRFAIIEDGRVTNIAEAGSEHGLKKGWVECADEVNIGDLLEGGEFIKNDTLAPMRQATASELLAQLTPEETEKLITLLEVREVIGTEKAKAMRGK